MTIPHSGRSCTESTVAGVPANRGPWCAPTVVLGVAISLFVPNAVCADDWPQFRGPNCSGVSTSTKPLPIEFSATAGVALSVEVGDGIG